MWLVNRQKKRHSQSPVIQFHQNISLLKEFVAFKQNDEASSGLVKAIEDLIDVIENEYEKPLSPRNVNLLIRDLNGMIGELNQHLLGRQNLDSLSGKIDKAEWMNQYGALVFALVFMAITGTLTIMFFILALAGTALFLAPIVTHLLPPSLIFVGAFFAMSCELMFGMCGVLTFVGPFVPQLNSALSSKLFGRSYNSIRLTEKLSAVLEEREKMVLEDSFMHFLELRKNKVILKQAQRTGSEFFNALPPELTARITLLTIDQDDADNETRYANLVKELKL